ncbi:MAG: cyclic nucleotide-binding domain-containing protein [Actinomycetota bacterium]
MARDRKVELLKKVSLFSACSDRELKRIASLADAVEVPEGKVLTKEGDPGREFFVIAEGQAKASIRGRAISDLKDGTFFGEMSLLDHGPRSATIVASTPMKLYVLDARGFGRFLEEVPIVARKIMRAMAERLRAADDAPSYTH